MRVLLVVAHPDDEILAAGGASHRWASKGWEVVPCILSAAAEARAHRPDASQLRDDMLRACREVGMGVPIEGSFPNIAMNTVPHLDLVQFIEGAIDAVTPSVIVTHHPGDVNDDHQQTSRACQAASRRYQRLQCSERLGGLLYAEVLSSTDWSFASNTSSFEPTAFVELREVDFEAKVRALESYRGVMRPHPHPRSSESLRALATLRGSQAGMALAEAFQVAHLDASRLPELGDA